MTPSKRSPLPARLRGAGIAVTLSAALATAGTAVAATGGSVAPSKPELTDVVCVEGCAGIDQVAVGGLVQARGRNLGQVTKLVFAGGAVGTAQVKSSTVIEARVPAGARSGKVFVEDNYGYSSRKSKQKLGIQPAGKLRASGEGPVIQAAQSGSKHFFYGAKRKGAFLYSISSEGPVSTRVDVIRQADGAIVRSIVTGGVQPFVLQQVVWDGTNTAGEVEREGRYTFKLSVAGANGATASSAGPADGTDGISFFRHAFPVRGPHTYGDGLGAGRGHKGQDLMARCGTRIAAARGGIVKWKAYHSRAGNYLVIDGEGTDVDYAYMHLRKPTPLAKGERVYTGQTIGNVGDTGDATACHLHFEMWQGGWYDGGQVIDPTPDLKAWDEHS